MRVDALRATLVVTAAAGIVGAAPAWAISRVTLTAESVTAADATLRGVRVETQLAANPSLKATIADARYQNHAFKNVALACPAIRFERASVACDALDLAGDGHALPLSVSYDTAKSEARFRSASAGKSWLDGTARTTTDALAANVTLSDAPLAALAAFVPAAYPKPTAGSLSGTIEAAAPSGKPLQAKADLSLKGVAFADTSGLHAGEKLEAKLFANVSGTPQALRFSLDAAYVSGELFWSPVYFATGGHRLAAVGSFGGNTLKLDSAVFYIGDAGSAQAAGEFTLAPFRITRLQGSTTPVDLKRAWPLVIQPFLSQTTLDKVELKGEAELSATIERDTLNAFDVQFRGVDVSDPQARFAFSNLTASVPWSRDGSSQGRISADSASLYRIPLGKLSLGFAMRGEQFRALPFEIPILDGALAVSNFRASHDADGWDWRFAGELKPMSLGPLTEALKIQRLEGALAATIPEVKYANQTVSVDGALRFYVFDGVITLDKLKLVEPLGRAPRLSGEIVMDHLDLGLVTRTFEFGRMEGRIDAGVRNLELANWRPVNFDARVASSPGNYNKRVSQQALQNISNIGGAGSTVAIQRTLLRFFDEFRYDKIGITCRLRNDLCVMGGIDGEAPPGGGFLIVKGAGTPQINVVGYNRNVGWPELLSRIQAAIKNNAKPVVVR